MKNILFKFFSSSVSCILFFFFFITLCFCYHVSHSSLFFVSVFAWSVVFLMSIFLNSFIFYFTFSFLWTTFPAVLKKNFQKCLYMHGLPLNILFAHTLHQIRKNVCSFPFFCWTRFHISLFLHVMCKSDLWIWTPPLLPGKKRSILAPIFCWTFFFFPFFFSLFFLLFLRGVLVHFGPKTQNPEPWTLNPEPLSLDPEPLSLNPWPWTIDPYPSAGDVWLEGRLKPKRWAQAVIVWRRRGPSARDAFTQTRTTSFLLGGVGLRVLRERGSRKEEQKKSTKNRCQNRPFFREGEGGSDLKISKTPFLFFSRVLKLFSLFSFSVGHYQCISFFLENFVWFYHHFSPLLFSFWMLSLLRKFCTVLSLFLVEKTVSVRWSSKENNVPLCFLFLLVFFSSRKKLAKYFVFTCFWTFFFEPCRFLFDFSWSPSQHGSIAKMFSFPLYFLLSFILFPSVLSFFVSSCFLVSFTFLSLFHFKLPFFLFFIFMFHDVQHCAKKKRIFVDCSEAFVFCVLFSIKKSVF